MTRRVLVFLADTHGGHKLSLLNPATFLLDGELRPYQVQLSAVQRWLWENYEDDIAAVERLADGDRVDVVHVGDVTWGLRYPQGLVSSRMADQVIIATSNLSPWLMLGNVKSLTLVTGTDSHELGEASAPILAARELRQHLMQADVSVTPHLLADVDGMTVDAAHHGPGKGRREWLSGNELRRYGQSLQEREALRGGVPPRLVIRAHTHEFWRETVRIAVGSQVYTTDLAICPAYCGLTPYAQQVMQSTPEIGCGVVAAEIIDGQLAEIHAITHRSDLRVRRRM